MRNSIYHFFANLAQNRSSLKGIAKLDNYTFPSEMLSCSNRGVWPDIAIKLNDGDNLFTGGELIELKDARGFRIASFNSTIPCGKKDISDILRNRASRIRKQMEEAGDDIFSLPIRDVFYLVRGHIIKDSAPRVRVCLVHGKFFETIPTATLVQESFRQIVKERLTESGTEISDSQIDKLVQLFDSREVFAKTRKVEKSSITVRFRVMTEVSQEANVLQYPQIIDNSLTLLLPIVDSGESKKYDELITIAFKDHDLYDVLNKIRKFEVKHVLNGPFQAYQLDIV